MITARTGKTLAFYSLALVATLVALAAMRFLTFEPTMLTEQLRPNLLEHPIRFYLHTTFAPVALLIGVWQFLPQTRRSAYHRWAGRLYVACCLIGALAGFSVAFTTEAGPLAAMGFVFLAVLWFGATVQAYRFARAGRFTEHRRWMIRSYALTCAAVSLRLILPIGMSLGLTFYHAYVVAAWSSWAINLAVVELVILRRSAAATVPRAA